MVNKSYLRYVPGPDGPIVCSSQGQAIVNLLFVASRGTTMISSPRPAEPDSKRTVCPVVVVPMLEHIGVWNAKTGELVARLATADARRGSTNEVTSLQAFRSTSSQSQAGPHVVHPSACWTRPVAYDPTSDGERITDGATVLVAAGFASGHVALWRCRGLRDWEPVLYALGHRPDTMVLTMCFNDDGTRLYTAGQDTDIAVWDVSACEPLYRLRGHRGAVVGLAITGRPVAADGNGPSSSAASLSTPNCLLSCGNDGLVKAWDLTIQQCVQTIVASDTQVTAMAVDPGSRRLLVGLREPHIKVFSLDVAANSTAAADEHRAAAPPSGSASSDHPTVLHEHGVLMRKTSKPVTHFAFSDDGHYVAAVSSRAVELFQVMSEDQVARKLGRKRARAKAQSNESPQGDATEPQGAAGGGGQRSAQVEFSFVRQFLLDDQIRGFGFAVTGSWPLPKPAQEAVVAASSGASSGSAAVTVGTFPTVVFTTAANSIQIHAFVPAVEVAVVDGAPLPLDMRKRTAIDINGHRDAIRSVAFSSTDLTLFSLSHDGLRAWGIPRTLDEHYASEEANAAAGATGDVQPAIDRRLRLTASIDFATSIANTEDNAAETAAVPPGNQGTCLAVLPGDQHIVVGFADGSLRVTHIGSLTVGPAIQAHRGGAPVTQLLTRPDGSGGLWSIGQDRRMLKWDLSLGADGVEQQDASPLDLMLTEEVELSEVPLCVAASNDQRLIGVGLQNHNVQLFYGDTLKPFVVLYGHKLSPTAIAFSSDGTLCATGGMDKSLRLWGTDFGDCHRSIHAHDDYVTAVRFVSATHYVATVSTDGTIKVWDGDVWTLIQRIKIFQRGLWTVAVNSDGTCLAAAGSDRCVRTMLRTEELIFPEEEHERMANEAQDDAAAKKQAMSRWEDVTTDSSVATISASKSATAAHAAEALMAALDLVSVEVQRLAAIERALPDARAKQQAKSPRVRGRRDEAETKEEREALVAAAAANAGVGALPHPSLRNRSPWQHLWQVLESIRPSELRHALSSLTSIHVEALLNGLGEMITHNAVLNYEVASRILVALVKPAPGVNSHVILPIAGDSGPRRTLQDLRLRIGSKLQDQSDRYGVNLAGLQHVKNLIAAKRVIRFADHTDVQGAKRKFHRSTVTHSK